MSSSGRREDLVFDGQKYWPAISSGPKTSLSVFDGDFTSSVQTGSASFNVSIPALADEYPGIENHRWAGSDVSLTYVDDLGVDRAIFAGKVSRFGEKNGLLAITAGIDEEPFKADVLSAEYAGTTGIEGGADIKGNPKPLIFGRAKNLQPVQINVVDNVFQVSSYGPIQAISAVYERGAAFGASMGDHANYAALVAADIPEGRWATCLADGLFRLGAPPYGLITADVDGLVRDSVWLRRTGAIIQALAEMAGVGSSQIDSASLAALDAAVPRNVNIVISGQIDVLSVAQRMALACNAQAGIDLLGRLFVTRVDIGSPVMILNGAGKNLPGVIDIAESSVRPPYKRIVMGADRTWRVHSFDEIAFQAELIDRGAYDAATVYREGNIVNLPDGSRWVFVGVTPLAGSTPSDANANWGRMSHATVLDFGDLTGTETLLADLEAAIALATARGKVWTSATIPSVAQSNVGDTWIAPDGVFYDRVNAGGIRLAGVVALAGYRPRIAWTRSVNQPLEATIATANDASAIADAAATRIEAYDDDDILDISEKRRMAVDDQQLEDAYQEIIVSAAAAGVSYSALTTARTAYLDFRNAISPAWNDTTQDSAVTRSSLDTVVNGYASAIETLRATIEVAVKGLVDTAQAAADAAQATADAAQAAADAAQATADAAEAGAAQANTVLANIANDDLLTPDEKPEVILKRDVILGEQAGIEASATSYGITTEKTAYTASITALTDYLATLTTPVLWSSLAGNTAIVGATFRTKFANVYAARQVVLNKIAAVTKGSIDTLSSDIATALALAASRGKVWTSATIPSVAQSNVGDTWIAPDGVFYDRVNAGGIRLAGVVALAGYRPRLAWTRSVNQPLEATIAATGTAQATADAAVLALSYLDDDGVLTVDEKIRRLIPDDAALQSSYATITATAASLSVSTADIAAKRAAWIALRDAISPAWNDTSQNSPVARNSLDAALLAYRDAFTTLRAAIENRIDELAAAAQATADQAVLDAAAAQAAADAAQADADTASAAAAQANTVLANIANDDLLTPGEKPEVILKRDVILGEQAGIEASANSYGITTEKTAYTASITELIDHLDLLTTPVLWSSLAGNTTINGSVFRSKFADVYAARQVVLNKIAAVAKANTDAATAGAAAANTRIAEISSDNLLTPVEKMQVILEYNALIGEDSALLDEAVLYGVTTQATNYSNAIDALVAYMATLTTPVLWSDLSGDTTIVGPTFRDKFLDVRVKKRLMTNEFRGAPAGTKVGPDFAENVAQGAGNALAGLNGDGTVKDDKVNTTAIIAGAITSFVLASCSAATRSYDGSADEICNVTVGTAPSGSIGVRVTANGDFKNTEAGPIESHIRLYKVPAAQVAAYEAYRDANGGEMGTYANVPLQSDMLNYAANVWDSFTLNYVDTAPATGDMYVCGLTAVSSMGYQHKNVQMTVELIKR